MMMSHKHLIKEEMAVAQNRLKAILVSSIGGGLELYDFTIFVFFAPIFAKLFFPAGDDIAALLNTFSVFAIGYFARPFGAFVFGYFGDRIGRKKGMLLSIAVMSIATMGIGLLPSYATIGILSPLLLILLRFLQGISVGGDLPGAIIFTAEYAHNNQRGFFCSLVYSSVNIGILLASLLSALLSSFLSQQQLFSWGWRIAFLLGLFIGVVGFYLRQKISETPYFHHLKQTKNTIKFPFLLLFQQYFPQLLKGIGLVWFFAVIISQIFLYTPTYLKTLNPITINTALVINSINLLVFALLIPVVGYISDYSGRKPVIWVTSLLFIVFTYPLYTLLHHSNFFVEEIVLLCFSILSAGIAGTVPAILSEIFPTQIRYSGVAIAYSIGFAVFGGLTPVILTFLIYKLNFIHAPSFNLILAAVVALIASLFIEERSGKSLEFI